MSRPLITIDPAQIAGPPLGTGWCVLARNPSRPWSCVKHTRYREDAEIAYLNALGTAGQVALASGLHGGPLRVWRHSSV